MTTTDRNMIVVEDVEDFVDLEAEEGEVTAGGRLAFFGASTVMIEDAPSPVNSSSDKSMNEVGEVNPAATRRPSPASLLQSL